MIELTQKLLSGIESGDEEAFLGAGEVGRFLIFGLKTSAIVEPYNSILARTPATEEDGEALQKALIGYIERTGCNANPGAIHAIGKFQNSKNIKFLREVLADNLEAFLEKNRLLYNTMDALDRSGESNVFGSSSGILDVESTIENSRKYLSTFGKVFPW